MNTSVAVWIGLGVLGTLIIASMDDDTSSKPDTQPTNKPKVEPKKIIL